jgi:palmitoyltransferase
LSWEFIIKRKLLKTFWSSFLFILESFSLIYFLLIKLRPGHVDYKKIDQNLKQGKFSKRFCRICDHQKPERTHHCSTCGKCIKKMDHHCIWMSVCVNYDNHGDFVRFLFFSSLSHCYISCVYIYNLYLVCKGKLIIPGKWTVVLCIFTVVALGFWLISGLIFKTQMKLILLNVTFLEEMALFEYDLEDNPILFKKYDLGTLKNLEDVFGPCYFLFLWRPRGDGVNFISNSDLLEPLYHSDYV